MCDFSTGSRADAEQTEVGRAITRAHLRVRNPYTKYFDYTESSSYAETRRQTETNAVCHKRLQLFPNFLRSNFNCFREVILRTVNR